MLIEKSERQISRKLWLFKNERNAQTLNQLSRKLQMKTKKHKDVFLDLKKKKSNDILVNKTSIDRYKK